MLKPAMERRLVEATEGRDEAVATFEDAIAAAWQAGASLGEIAREIGWTHQGVSDLLARTGVRRKWRSLAEANAELDRREQLEREASDD